MSGPSIASCKSFLQELPASVRGHCPQGDSIYLGTEVDLGLTWRFAPGLMFDLVGAVLFSGGAFDTSEIRNGVLTRMDSKNIYTIASRVRVAF